MGRIVYVPDNDKVWTEFFATQVQQNGHGFQGIPYQRGHGLGSFFGRLFRSILPVAKRVGKRVAKTVGKEALNMGANVLEDVAQGKDIGESAKEQGIKSARKLINRAGKAMKNQSGKGLGKRKVGCKTTVVARKKAKPDYLTYGKNH